MSDEFFNPFHFVPVAKPDLELMPREDVPQRPSERKSHQHVTHDRYVTQTIGSGKTPQKQAAYSGRIVCRLKTVTPTVLGASRKDAAGDQAAIVHPFEVPAIRNNQFVMEPAVPESSLRGMISSLYEALTNSSLRVLNNTPLSIRMNAIVDGGMSEALQAVGMIHEQNGKRLLLPLTFPSLPGGIVPAAFHPFETSAELRVYVDGVDARDSHTPDSQGIYFLKINSNLPRPTAHQFGAIPNSKDRGGIVGWGTSSIPITPHEWSKLPPADQSAYVPGLLRHLKGASAETLKAQRLSDANGDRDLPRNVKHGWFIPLNPRVFDRHQKKFVYQQNNVPMLDAEAAATVFEKMAAERTHSEPQLPYELRGSMRNSKSKSRKNNDSHAIRLRTGDLVCFSLSATGQSVAELAISSIWRRPAGSVHGWFRQIGENLLPMNATRTQLTLAEQVFGFVEQDDIKNKSPRSKALAGRVRFSTGRLVPSNSTTGHYLAQETMPILSSPKPPCPPLYFYRTDSKPARKSGFPRTESGDIRPLGRKAYLIHDESLLSWISTNNDPRLNKQKAKVTPIRPNTEFLFDITFDNLSAFELGTLLLCLKPNENFCHRIGMGKPFGLGTVSLSPVGLFLVDRPQRYGQSDQWTASRYSKVSLFDPKAVEFLSGVLDAEMKTRYAAERATVALGSGKDWHTLKDAALQRIKQLYPDSLIAVESLGNPNVTKGKPVHHPRLPDEWLGPDIASRETELFRWHVWNEKRRSHHQHLKPLSKTGPFPRTLRKRTPFRFFLYSGLDAEDRQQLFRDLAKRFPEQFHPLNEAGLKPNPADYAAAIRRALDGGEIPVHLGTSNDGDVRNDQKVSGFGPISLLDRNGRPVHQSVWERWKKTYLPPELDQSYDGPKRPRGANQGNRR